MMTNEEFLEVIRESFKTYLTVGTSRSTAKLKNVVEVYRMLLPFLWSEGI